MVHLLLVIIYLAFFSLGLPDSLLGSAWPVMYKEFGTPVSYAGILSMIIAAGTVVSSLQAGKLERRFGAGRVTAASVAITAAALAGFSYSHSFRVLCLWAVPYGLGAGSVDAVLNNYVALNYASSHMSWLHCMWGLGAAAGPYIMGHALSGQKSWNMGYRYIGIIQVILSVVLIAGLPLWQRNKKVDMDEREPRDASQLLSLRQIVKIPCVKEIMLIFFCYSALEQTTGLWAGSYLVLYRGISAEAAAGFAGLFFAGVTAGRAVCGFLTMKYDDIKMVRIGFVLLFAGIISIMFPYGKVMLLAGLVLAGFGCAPVYPCILHSIPERFGTDKSQSMIGVQMAAAYAGTCLMPPLSGLIIEHISASFFPFYIMAILVVMAVLHGKVFKKCKKRKVQKGL